MTYYVDIQQSYTLSVIDLYSFKHHFLLPFMVVTVTLDKAVGLLLYTNVSLS